MTRRKQGFFILNRTWILIFLLIQSLGSFAQSFNDESYYGSAEGKLTSALKTQLSSIISANYVTKSYDYLYTIYETSDVTASGKIWDMYSTCTWTFGNKQCGNYSTVCDCYNREHSIPQSWFNEQSPMKSDAFHVYPTDGKVNGQRSNYPFGECSSGTSLGSNALGKLGYSTFAGYTDKVFEPDDEYKGDFARTYFYFVTRYESKMSSFSGDSFAKNTYPSLSEWSINLFLKWHRQDPVSEKEINRNEAVFAYQKNRNPFIDHPELAEYIWGTCKGEPWNISTGILSATSSKTEVQITYTGNGTLSVTTKEPKEVHYTIYGIAGNSLQEGDFLGTTELNINYLPKGIYLFKATTNSGQKPTVQKFLIQ